jgi:hypothetical protein
MTSRKLPSSSPSAKASGKHAGASRQYLHFVASVRKRGKQYLFVCEARPLLASTSHGTPMLLPLCTEDDPIGTPKSKQKR